MALSIIICGTERNNNHYIVCSWYNQNFRCKPDTCPCVVVIMTYYDLKKKLYFLKKTDTVDFYFLVKGTPTYDPAGGT